METATTFDEIFTSHGSMLDLICSRSLVTVKGHPHMSKLINRVITLAINFKQLKNNGELDSVYKDFVRHCTDIKYENFTNVFVSFFQNFFSINFDLGPIC